MIFYILARLQASSDGTGTSSLRVLALGGSLYGLFRAIVSTLPALPPPYRTLRSETFLSEHMLKMKTILQNK
jgi:hypothetical protein